MRVHRWLTHAFYALAIVCVCLVPATSMSAMKTTPAPTAMPTQTTVTTETPTVQEIAAVIGDNAVRYPQLSGMADAQKQQAINDAIVEKAEIARRMLTLSTLQAGQTGLQVSYEAYLNHQVFSTVICAKGIMGNGRSGQEYVTLNYDLSTGNPLTLANLFSEPQTAVTFMEETLNATYADELGSYADKAAFTPLPQDIFSLDEDGITFYYPYQQFSFVSGYCGAAQFNCDELANFWITDAESVPARIGALAEQRTDAEIQTAIKADISEGRLPRIHARLGDSMTELITRYRLLRQPDQYPGGRYFQLEAPAFRQTMVLSDALTPGWKNSLVEGLLSFRTNLYGIQTGETTRDRWLEVLGNPESTVAFDENMAYDYGFPVGTADYYTFGNHQLLLYADENGVLYAVRLTQ